MNIALTHIPAAASARFSGKQAFVRAVVLGCVMACASLPAFAQDRDRDRDGQRRGPPQQQQQPSNREQPRAERMAPPQQQPQYQQREQRQVEPRQFDARVEEQRRQAAQQEQGAQRRPGRLTPDERRELRRQINEAGIDLYPNTPRR